jgi:hypothetical protein
LSSLLAARRLRWAFSGPAVVIFIAIISDMMHLFVCSLESLFHNPSRLACIRPGLHLAMGRPSSGDDSGGRANRPPPSHRVAVKGMHKAQPAPDRGLAQRRRGQRRPTAESSISSKGMQRHTSSTRDPSWVKSVRPLSESSQTAIDFLVFETLLHSFFFATQG